MGLLKMSTILVKIVRTSYVCDQNGRRVSKNDICNHICRMRVNDGIAQYEKFGLCLNIEYVNVLKSEKYM